MAFLFVDSNNVHMERPSDSRVWQEPMHKKENLFPTANFAGELSGTNHPIVVNFTATIDFRGDLHVEIAPLAVTAEVFSYSTQSRLGDAVDLYRLVGTALTGETFASDAFMINSFGTSSNNNSPAICQLSGRCLEATIERPLKSIAPKSQLIWGVRQFQAFGPLINQTAAGLIRIGGELCPDDDQALSGLIEIESPSSANAPSWWHTAATTIDHVARVLSVASGTYLRPYVERRISPTLDVLKVIHYTPASPGYLAPFHHLNMAPIFACASGATQAKMEAFKQFDPAVQWLLAPASYNEIRLITAMTALENILERSDISKEFIEDDKFTELASRVREVIATFGAPAEMDRKVPELNRRALAKRLFEYLHKHGIAIADCPKKAIYAALYARNDIVHRGIYYGASSPDKPHLFAHILVIRELVIRILLTALNFQGNYVSALHGGDELQFPTCQPVK